LQHAVVGVEKPAPFRPIRRLTGRVRTPTGCTARVSGSPDRADALLPPARARRVASAACAISFDVATKLRILDELRAVVASDGYVFLGSSELMTGTPEGYITEREGPAMWFRPT
jgi:hypothetical protein